MKKSISLLMIFLIFSVLSDGQEDQKGQFPAGIVYGPKGAYQISAPDNWVLDNNAGISMGLPCVLYIKGYTWANSPVIMYALIGDSEYVNIDVFIKSAIREFKKEDPKFYSKEIKKGLTEGKKYVIMNYKGGPYNSYERAVYFQMEKAIGFIVFSSKNKEDFDKYADAIFEIVSTFRYTPEYIRAK